MRLTKKIIILERIELKMKNKPFNTLFMICSLDGKISTGGNDERDIDKDFPRINNLREGIKQYYQLEKRTDIHSFNTGRVMAKIGVNTKHSPINIPVVSFIIVDNHHLTENGVNNLVNGLKKLYIVTTNKNHPAFKIRSEKLEVIYYNEKIDFVSLFIKLRSNYGIKRITIQSGETINSILTRKRLIDRVSVVIAPALIGGKNTSSLVDGESLKSISDLKKITTLKLLKINKLKKSYIHLVYEVLN